MTTNMADSIQDYLHFLRVEKQLAQNTLISYEKDLKSYIKDLSEAQQIQKLQDVERIHILAHLQNRKTAGHSARTLARHISSIRSFHQFLLLQNLIEWQIQCDPILRFQVLCIPQQLR